MGHDTYAFRDAAHSAKTDRDANFHRLDPEVAYLRRSMSCRDNDLIYEALGPRALKHYAGVSGDGTEETFTKDELRAALARLETASDCEDQRQFLTQCLEAPGESVLIGFF